MLLLAENKQQWFSNKVFSSISFAKEKFGGREYYIIDNTIIPKSNNAELEREKDSHWIKFMLGEGQVKSTEWLTNYKNNKHPNDDWTHVDLITYSKYIYMFNYKEVSDLIDSAMKDGVLGYLD
jgi:hypothetical protein